MIDVDHFKAFNDCNGHLHGNVALQELAALMKSVVRDIDVVTRYGGEEFAVILCGTSQGWRPPRCREDPQARGRDLFCG